MRGWVAPAIRSTFAARQRKRARSHHAAASHLHRPRNTQILPTAWQSLARVSHVRAARARACNLVFHAAAPSHPVAKSEYHTHTPRHTKNYKLHQETSRTSRTGSQPLSNSIALLITVVTSALRGIAAAKSQPSLPAHTMNICHTSHASGAGARYSARACSEHHLERVRPRAPVVHILSGLGVQHVHAKRVTAIS